MIFLSKVWRGFKRVLKWIFKPVIASAKENITLKSVFEFFGLFPLLIVVGTYYVYCAWYLDLGGILLQEYLHRKKVGIPLTEIEITVAMGFMIAIIVAFSLEVWKAASIAGKDKKVATDIIMSIGTLLFCFYLLLKTDVYTDVLIGIFAATIMDVANFFVTWKMSTRDVTVAGPIR